MWEADAPLRLRREDVDSDCEDFDETLVIGIDFGTTYSGVAWATKTDFESEQINLITTWPGSGREEGKAPTELYYEDDKIMWGYEVESDVDPIKWFKLLLLKEEDLSPELRSSEFLLRARKMMRENGKTAIDLISDYLRLLWAHTLEIITKDRGETVLEALQLHVVITVPAIWKGYARQDMEQAARRAGILDRRPAGPTLLTFAPEPEAAALSTLCEPGKRTKKGEVYLICDAGGGTVDLISYEISSTDPILMREAVEGTGGLCGGIFIDEAFEYIAKNRLGRKWDRLSRAGIKEILKGEWELSIKPQFKPGSTKKEYMVSIPAEAFGKQSLTDMSKEPYIKNGRIHFNESHIEKAFTAVFADIDKLIEAQISKVREQGLSLTGIILVGGLGGSPYLYEHLKARHSPAKISILQSAGMRPRTAICRGAVFKGFLDGKATGFDVNGSEQNIMAPIQVTSTISRASYGVMFQVEFDESKHLLEDKIWDADEGNWKATNQMRWYVTKGENVSKKEPVTHEFYRVYRKDFNMFSVELLQCEDDIPPTRMVKSVKSLGTIECTLDTPFSALADFWNLAGEKLKKMEYELKMVPSGASLEFAVFANGNRLGKSNAHMHFK
ncbi:hypothetical protein FZEAL_2142 [Fusarium zealandicum]|uniref:Actin-like ATPase domain-containing protein n=1 Tax=Fusarium zealandicum TaxID=1053134 RepID=A0A8H4XN09_9HYPO|nr:hypothetical protein FZEAL_2142 [Fusarium zealandicum]